MKSIKKYLKKSRKSRRKIRGGTRCKNNKNGTYTINIKERDLSTDLNKLKHKCKNLLGDFDSAEDLSHDVGIYEGRRDFVKSKSK